MNTSIPIWGTNKEFGNSHDRKIYFKKITKIKTSFLFQNIKWGS